MDWKIVNTITIVAYVTSLEYMNLTTQQLLTVRKILDRHIHHNVSIHSTAYKEIEAIIEAITEILISK